jgi:hypothetical protein
MRRTLIIPTALVLSALALSGCAAGSTPYDTAQSGGVPAPSTEQGTQATDGVKSESVSSDPQVGAIDRQVITTGYVTITVEDPMDAATQAIRIAESAGGRIDGRSEYAPVDDNDKGSAMLTLRIPASVLTATLDKLRELGEVQEVSLNSSDVTMVTQDLDARITALGASVDRLLALLATATDTDTLISLETAISDRQAQLESLESERRYYADQVSLSTVTVNLVSEYNAPVEEPDSFLSGLEAGWDSFVGFFAGLLVALGVLLPWLVLAGIVTLVVIVLVRRRRRPVE